MPHVSAGRMDHVRKNFRSTKLQQILHNILHDLRPEKLESTSTRENENNFKQIKTKGIQHDQTQDYYIKFENLHKFK